MVNSIALSVRAKKLGALLRDARLAKGSSLETCAQAVGVSPEQFEAFEMGEKPLSLPELELLAYYLEVPLQHFWGDQSLSGGDEPKLQKNPQHFLGLRQRMVGAKLRQARLEAGLSLEELAEKSWSSASLLESYELGEAAVPLPDLEVLASILNRPISDFQDHNGPVGAWEARQRAVEGFLELSTDLQAFVSKPINRPYLELARRLSEMDVEKLRAVAEGLLEITL
jgi:transcriptional regulator with XRE-family HTH domain